MTATLAFGAHSMPAGRRRSEDAAPVASPAPEPHVRSTETVMRWLTALSIGVSVAVFGLGATVLFEARTDAWRQAETNSTNLTLALERDIGRNIAVYDLSLQGAIEVLHEPGIDTIAPVLRQAAIFDRAASAEFLGAVLVLDTAGNVTASSISALPPHLNLADRDYFTAQRDQAEAGLFISKPFLSRLRDGDPSIGISRRLSDADGRFKGVVLGTLRLAYFQKLFSNFQLGRKGAINLIRDDGRLLARSPVPCDRHRDQSRRHGKLQDHHVDAVRRLRRPRHHRRCGAADRLPPHREPAVGRHGVAVGARDLCRLVAEGVLHRLDDDFALRVDDDAVHPVPTRDAASPGRRGGTPHRGRAARPRRDHRCADRSRQPPAF